MYRRSLELTPGEPVSVVPPSDLRITNVALGDELADESGRTSVKLTYRGPKEDEEEEYKPVENGDDVEEEQDNEDEDEDEEGGSKKRKKKVGGLLMWHFALD